MHPSIGDGKIRTALVVTALIVLLFIGIGITAGAAYQTSFQKVGDDYGWINCHSSSYWGYFYCNNELSISAGGPDNEILSGSNSAGCFETTYEIYASSGRVSEGSLNYLGCGGWDDYCYAYIEFFKDDGQTAMASCPLSSCSYGTCSYNYIGQYNWTISPDMEVRCWANGSMVYHWESLDYYPKYVGISATPYACTFSTTYYDDFCIGSGCSTDAVVGSLPDFYYLKKDLFNPLDSGIYLNTSLMSSEDFYIDYQISGVPNNTPKHLQLINEESGVSYEQYTTYLTSSVEANYPVFHMSSLTSSGAPYGQYAVKIIDSSGPTVVTREGQPFWYITGGASIQWDKKEYVTGENPVISWTVSDAYWQPADYIYKLHIMKADGTQKLSEPYTITSKTGSYTVSDTSDYTAGDYWTYLGMIPKSGSANESIAAYDFTSFTREVRVRGYTLDAFNDVILPSVAIGFNSTTWHNTTSDGTTAFYQVNGLDVRTIPVQATLAGYQTDNFNFRPPSYGFYNVNMSLLPNYIPNNTAIAGTTVVDWNHNAVPGATVYISNDTWNDTTTSDDWSYYIFDNLLPDSTYHIRATKTGYQDSITYSVNTTSLVETTQTIELPPLYTLTVNLVDLQTGVPITAEATVNITAVNQTPQSATTTSGTTAFSVPMGVWTATAYAMGYYGAMDTAIVVGDKTLVLSLSENQGATNYTSAPATRFLTPPHSVRFLCTDVFGNPISGLNVTATGMTTTLPAWSWFYSIFGINMNETPMQNVTMAGTTDSAGGVTFLMHEDINYQVTFKNTTTGINEIRNYYPKEDQYSEVFWPNAPKHSSTQLSYSLYNVTNGTNLTLGLLYSDSLGHTTNLTFYVEDWDSKQILYQNTTAGPLSSANPTYTLPITKGATYVWGFNSTVSDYKKPVHLDNYIRFAGQKRLIDLGVGDSDMADQMYNWLAVGLIVSFGAIFGRFTLKYGMPLTALWGAFWWIAGWLMAPGLLVAMAACIGVFAAFRSGQEESGL